MAINAYMPSVQRWHEHTTLTALNAIDNVTADTELLGAPGEGRQYLLFGWAAGTNDEAEDHFAGVVKAGSASPGTAALGQICCNLNGPEMPFWNNPVLCGDNNKIYFDATNVPSAESSPLNLIALYYAVVDV